MIFMPRRSCSADGSHEFLPQFVESPYFDVASDAFATLKDSLTKHKALISSFLDASYDQFFRFYMRLVSSENYVTKRQSVKLLGK